MKQVPVLKAFQFAFEMIRKNFAWVATFSLIATLFEAIRLIPNYLFPADPENWGNLVVLLVLIPEIMIQYRIIKLGLKAFDKEDRAISYFEVGFPKGAIILQLIAVSFIFGVLIVLGMLALVIPFFVMLTTYMFVVQIFIDTDESIPSRRVFRISEHLTDGVKWKLMGYVAIMTIPYIVSFAFGYSKLQQNILWKDIIVILIGLLVYPIQSFSMVYLYKSLKQQSEVS